MAILVLLSLGLANRRIANIERRLGLLGTLALGSVGPIICFTGILVARGNSDWNRQIGRLDVGDALVVLILGGFIVGGIAVVVIKKILDGLF